MVDFETVQSLIWDESNSLTMIYATDGAMDTPRIELPGGLQRFIKADNRSFQKELEQEEAAADANADIPMETLDSFDLQPRSRSLSVDSMATNRASLGSMDSREDDFGLEDFLPPSSMDVEYHQGGNVDHGHRRDVTPNQGLIHSSGMESPVLGHVGPEGSAVNVGDIPLPPPAKSKSDDSDDDDGDDELQEVSPPPPPQEMKDVSTKSIFIPDPPPKPGRD